MNKPKYRDVYVCNNPGFYFYKHIPLLFDIRYIAND